MTDYLADKVAQHVLMNVAYTSPATVYLALYSTPTTAAGGGTEVGGGSYARLAISFTDPGDPGLVEQDATLTFNDMPGVTVTHIAIHDHISAGNMLIFGALRSPRTVGAGQPFVLGAGDIRVLFD
jgi:hypothetical protein